MSATAVAAYCVIRRVVRRVADNQFQRTIILKGVSATKKRFHSRYNFGYGIFLYIRKMPVFRPKTALFGGFKGVFSFANDKSAILCPTKTEVAEFVSFKGSIVQVLNYCIDCNM